MLLISVVHGTSAIADSLMVSTVVKRKPWQGLSGIEVYHSNPPPVPETLFMERV
jgi:hypothetical protein